MELHFKFSRLLYHDSDGILLPYDHAYNQTILITINLLFTCSFYFLIDIFCSCYFHCLAGSCGTVYHGQWFGSVCNFYCVNMHEIFILSN
jgi:hypothetical protein